MKQADRPLAGLRELVSDVARSFFRHDGTTYAMALAFRGLLALFPFALFLVALLGFLRVDAILGWLADQGPAGLQSRVPEPVDGLLEQAVYEDRGGLLFFGIVVAFWSVSAGARLLAKALNEIFEVEERRPGWKRAVSSLTFAPGLALAGAVAVGLMLFTSRAIAWLAGWVGLEEDFVFLWTLLRVPVALLLLALIVSVIYRFAPNVGLPFRALAPGAVLAVVLWAIASSVFAFALSKFPDYGAAYGGISAAISLLVYLYLSAIIVLLGAEVNAAIHRQSSNREGSGGQAADPELEVPRRSKTGRV